MSFTRPVYRLRFNTEIVLEVQKGIRKFVNFKKGSEIFIHGFFLQNEAEIRYTLYMVGGSKIVSVPREAFDVVEATKTER